MKCAAIIICCILIDSSIHAQSLKAYVGAGAGGDVFIRNKQITTNKVPSPLISPQLMGGFRYQTAQNFDLMLDFTLGLSRINMPTGYSGNKLIYEQARSLITFGSGLHIELDEERSVMPYVQLGVGFYDFRGITEKTSAGKFSTASDYNTRHWAPVCGAGIEYTFRMLGSSSINFKCLYTPVDIFTEPVQYDLYGQTNTGRFALQGKMLQFILSYQVNINIFNRNTYRYN